MSDSDFESESDSGNVMMTEPRNVMSPDTRDTATLTPSKKRASTELSHLPPLKPNNKIKHQIWIQMI